MQRRLGFFESRRKIFGCGGFGWEAERCINPPGIHGYPVGTKSLEEKPNFFLDEILIFFPHFEKKGSNPEIGFRRVVWL